MNAEKTGRYLASLRKEKGLTQQEIADQLGVSNKTISKWESGGGFPDIAVLPALGALYGVTADEILAGEARARAAGAAGGPSQVERYLARRGELRFRLGAAVSAMCLLGACLFRRWQLMPLLMAGAALALWVGWGPCGRERLPGRLRAALPLATVGAYLAVWRFAPWGWLGDLLREWGVYDYFTLFPWAKGRAVWTAALVLLPVLYALARWIARRWSGEPHLLDRPFFWTAAAGWIASVGVDTARWAVEIPRFLAYLAECPSQEAVMEGVSSWEVKAAEEALAPLVHTANAGRQVALVVLFLALAALAVLWLRKNTPRPLAERAET